MNTNIIQLILLVIALLVIYNYCKLEENFTENNIINNVALNNIANTNSPIKPETVIKLGSVVPKFNEVIVALSVVAEIVFIFAGISVFVKMYPDIIRIIKIIIFFIFILIVICI